MQKILFVCLGNICRSPLAEGIMLHLKEEYKLDIEIDSAGTAGYHIGETPDNQTIANAKKNGIDLSDLRARQFSESDFEKFDSIFVMDKSNLKNVLALAKDQTQREKVCLFLNSAYPKKDLEVPDPYYGTAETFEEVFRLLYEACKTFSQQFIQAPVLKKDSAGA